MFTLYSYQWSKLVGFGILELKCIHMCYKVENGYFNFKVLMFLLNSSECKIFMFMIYFSRFRLYINVEGKWRNYLGCRSVKIWKGIHICLPFKFVLLLEEIFFYKT